MPVTERGGSDPVRPVQEACGLRFTPMDTGYWRCTTGDRDLMHRVVWRMHHGQIPDEWDIHHIDGDRANNSIENLECLPKSQHGAVHNESHPTPEKHCVNCGKQLKRKRYPSGRLEPPSGLVKRKFCDPKCHGDWSKGRPRNDCA